MGLIIRNKRFHKPIYNSQFYNGYLDNYMIWNYDAIVDDDFFEFEIEGNSFEIPCSGVNGGGGTYQNYNWRIDWGDNQTSDVSGTGSATKTIPHAYSSNKRWTITINSLTQAQGWFNAFGSGPSQNVTNLAKIKKINSSITPKMRTISSYSHYQMFINCTGLKYLPENLLPETTLVGTACYSIMFKGCTGLQNIPSKLLPAPNLATQCYLDMFSDCTGLQHVPKGLLDAATVLKPGCYMGLFIRATGIKTIGFTLPAKTMVTQCYRGMFYLNPSLTEIPEGFFNATSLAEQCYYDMFLGCIGLTALPRDLLPVTTLATSCYQVTFSGCTNLVDLGNINAAWFTARDSLKQTGMFAGCTKIATPISYSSIPAGWK
jgi:hypothetical protein